MELGAWLVRSAERLLSPLLRRVIEPDDDETQRVRKVSHVIISLAVLSAVLIHLVPSLILLGTYIPIYYTWCAAAMASSIFTLVYLVVVKHAGDTFNDVMILVYVGIVILIDLTHLTEMSFDRGAVLFVITLDHVVLSNARITGLVLFLIAAWLALTESDILLRWGLLDLPGTTTVAMRREIMCDCETPPCGVPVPLFLRTSVLMLFTFGLDFYLTRRFARLATEERDHVTAAVRTTNSIAQCFANFNLDRAAVILAAADELPDDLAHALGTILDNLTSYKPYLPSAFFEHANEPVDKSVPGGDGRSVGMVFTDIRHSTALWEHNPGAMLQALDIHNRILRAALAEHGGYEVKTIGDSFMVAFHTARDAVRFGLDVQRVLCDTVWPAGLSRSEEDGYDVMVLRIGVHYGDVSLEQNPSTGRYDYFGSTVNKTARVEANAAPGAVTVTTETLENMTQDLASDIVRLPYKEPRFAKGFATGLCLTALLPHGHRYTDVVRQHCDAAQAESPQQRLGGSPHSPRIDRTHSFRSSDGGGSPSNSGRAQNSNAPTRLTGPVAQLYEGVGTVCVVHLQSVAHLRMLGSCLSHGLLSTVVGSFAVVSWGANRPLSGHFKFAVTFLEALHGELSLRAGDAPVEFHSGLASGHVATEHLTANASQRFLTVTGSCIDLGVMLCAAAAEMDTHALAATLRMGIGVEDTEIDVVTRPVDVWSFPDMEASARKSISVASADAEDVLELSKNERRAGAKVCVYDVKIDGTSPDSTEYASAFQRGDTQTMQQRAAALNDRVLLKACRLAERGMQLPHPFACGTSESCAVSSFSASKFTVRTL